jgi:hypothetical protein
LRPFVALLLLAATACPAAPDEPSDPVAGPSLGAVYERFASTTSLAYVQLGWTGEIRDATYFDGPCRPADAEPSDGLLPTDDGRWTAHAIGDVRIPCGQLDAMVVHVRPTDHLKIDAPVHVRVGETFSVRVSAHDRDDQLLQRNSDEATWHLEGALERGNREGCMDIRSNHGDLALVHATAVGTAPLRVRLGELEATVDVTVAPADR